MTAIFFMLNFVIAFKLANCENLYLKYGQITERKVFLFLYSPNCSIGFHTLLP
jgi:hypothetical protein